MQHAAARSAPIENAPHAASPSGEVVPITLGVQRLTVQRQHGTLRELILSIVSANEPAEPVPVQASANATLLLTDAEFAPPEALLPLMLRIVGFAVVASGCGAAAHFVLALIH